MSSSSTNTTDSDLPRNSPPATGSGFQDGPIIGRSLSHNERNLYNSQQWPMRRSSHNAAPARLPTYPNPSNRYDGDLPPLPVSEMSAEARRQSMVAMDRKRRLTGSAHETGRRRNTSGGFRDRDDRFSSTTSSSSHSQQHSNGMNMTGLTSRPNEVIDLTMSSPPPDRVPENTRRPSLTSSNNSRNYVVPRWQPDSEVSECPICHRQFSLLFRRHHCRKCGRVVCNDCSPHRITIPRQFIVHPPSIGPASLTRGDDVVDLTGEDDGGEATGNNTLRRFQLNQALGGGEKVRLCNPCVPDPQPNPEPDYSFPFTQQPPGFMPPRGPPNFHGPPNLASFPAYPGNLLGSRAVRETPPSHAPHPGSRYVYNTQDDEDESGSSPEAYTAAPRHQILVSNVFHVQNMNANVKIESDRSRTISGHDSQPFSISFARCHTTTSSTAHYAWKSP